MTPRRTGRALSHGKDRATVANANTTERSATLLENQLLDDHRGKSRLLDLHKQLEIRL